MFYGSEAWTLKAITQKRYSRILRISWTERVPYARVFQLVRRNRELLLIIKQTKEAYLVLVLRNEWYQLLQLIMMRKICGNDYLEKEESFVERMLRNNREWTNIGNVEELFRLTQVRTHFAELKANLLKESTSRRRRWRRSVGLVVFTFFTITQYRMKSLPPSVPLNLLN